MRRISIILISLASLCISMEGADKYNTNAKLKAMFIYNFTKYIEWPAEYKQGNFIIGHIGDSPLFMELEKVAATKKAVAQTIEIKKFSSADEISKCHMLFLPKGNTTSLESCKNKVGGNSTLIITEEPASATKGAGINFVIKDSKQKFEINKRIMSQRSLNVSSTLLSLAIIVE